MMVCRGTLTSILVRMRSRQDTAGRAAEQHLLDVHTETEGADWQRCHALDEVAKQL